MWLVRVPVPTPNRECPGSGEGGLWGALQAPQRPHTIFPPSTWLTPHPGCCPLIQVRLSLLEPHLPGTQYTHHSQRHSHFIFEETEALNSLTHPDSMDYTWDTNPGWSEAQLCSSSLIHPQDWEGGEVQGVRKYSVPVPTVAREAPAGSVPE